MLATSFLFTKSISSLHLLYLDTPLFLLHFSIHMYLSALHPSHLYYLHLDFWSLDPLVPDPVFVNTYSSIVSFSYCMQLTCLPGHHLALLFSYITYSYFACSSLVCISNKILPFSPLCLPLKTSWPNSWEGCKIASKASPICRSVIACVVAITPLITMQFACLHQLLPLASLTCHIPCACPSLLHFHLCPLLIRRTGLDKFLVWFLYLSLTFYV